MRILFIRHGDPDYSIDSLTEQGWKEAQLLSERMAKETIRDFYCSPLGRAKDTASLTLEKMGRTAEICPWLAEFDAAIKVPYMDEPKHIPWDIMPKLWKDERAFDSEKTWLDSPIMDGVPGEGMTVAERYKWVSDGIDGILARYGYIRHGDHYTCTGDGNRDTIAIFCHFGVTGAMLGHILGISPVLIWHGMILAPTSVTTVYTEEREKGEISFRAAALGDTSHLYVAGEQPSFSGRFCERYCDEFERH